jgi:hypothetical protein
MYEVEFSLYKRPNVFKTFEKMICVIQRPDRLGGGYLSPEETMRVIREDHGIELEECTVNPVPPVKLYRARFQDEQHYLMWMLKYG